MRRVLQLRSGNPWSVRGIGMFLLAVFLTASLLFAQGWIETLHADRGAGYRLLYLPSGRFLQVSTLGFSQLWADVIYLWSIQFYAEPMTEEGRALLEHIYGSVLAELDPHYLDPYMTGALIMSGEGGDIEMALRLLDQGMENNPEEWILPADAGFYSYLNLKDFSRSRAYFRRAMEIPGAPAPLSRLHAGMIEKMGSRDEAYRAWLEIYESAEDDYTRQISQRHVHDLKIERDLEILTSAVQDYRDRTGALPPSLIVLVEEGWISAVPTDPVQRPYHYNPETGEVSCTTRFRLWRGV